MRGSRNSGANVVRVFVYLPATCPPTHYNIVMDKCNAILFAMSLNPQSHILRIPNTRDRQRSRTAGENVNRVGPENNNVVDIAVLEG